MPTSNEATTKSRNPQQLLSGERALFQGRDLQITDCVFEDGESPLKESRNIVVRDSVFRWKYPLWYSEGVEVEHSLFEFNAHAAFWYSKNMTFHDCTIQAPKEFRRNEHVTVERTAFTDAAETFWECRKVTLREVSAAGDYYAMNSEIWTYAIFSSPAITVSTAHGT